MPTVKELKAQAKEAGIEGYSSMKKAELKAALAGAPAPAENKVTWSTEAERQEVRAKYLKEKRDG